MGGLVGTEPKYTYELRWEYVVCLQGDYEITNCPPQITNSEVSGGGLYINIGKFQKWGQ